MIYYCFVWLVVLSLSLLCFPYSTNGNMTVLHEFNSNVYMVSITIYLCVHIRPTWHTALNHFALEFWTFFAQALVHNIKYIGMILNTSAILPNDEEQRAYIHKKKRELEENWMIDANGIRFFIVCVYCVHYFSLLCIFCWRWILKRFTWVSVKGTRPTRFRTKIIKPSKYENITRLMKIEMQKISSRWIEPQHTTTETIDKLTKTPNRFSSPVVDLNNLKVSCQC